MTLVMSLVLLMSAMVENAPLDAVNKPDERTFSSSSDVGRHLRDGTGLSEPWPDTDIYKKRMKFGSSH